MAGKVRTRLFTYFHREQCDINIVLMETDDDWILLAKSDDTFWRCMAFKDRRGSEADRAVNPPLPPKTTSNDRGTCEGRRGYSVMTKPLSENGRIQARRTVKVRPSSVASLGATETLMLKTMLTPHKRRSLRPTFITLDRFRVKKLGVLVTVELDRQSDDFAHLIGKKIVIDGKIETCFSVERLPHAPPIKKGERVSLLISKS